MQPGSFWEAVRLNAEAFRREAAGVPQGFWRTRPGQVLGLMAQNDAGQCFDALLRTEPIIHPEG